MFEHYHCMKGKSYRFCKRILSILIFFSFFIFSGCTNENNHVPSTLDCLRIAYEQKKVVREIVVSDDDKCQLGFIDGTSLNLNIDTIHFCYYCHNEKGWFVSDNELELFDSAEGMKSDMFDMLENSAENKESGLTSTDEIYVTSVFEGVIERKVRINLSNNKSFVFDKTTTIFLELTLENPSSDIYEDLSATIASNYLNIIEPCYSEGNTMIPRFKVPDGCRVYTAGMEVISGETLIDFSNPVFFDIKPESGEVNSYKVERHNTGLPTLYIDTPNGTPVESKEEWIKDVSIKLYDNNGEIDYKADDSSIKGRGNSTWNLPKKPYTLKLGGKSELLGMPSSKRWVLLANWADRTLLRNVAAFEISRNTGLEWTPRGQFVELVLNGKHQGNYYLCEQISIGKDRVNIEEMRTEDIDGDNLTGGYLLELDVNYDERNKFKSELYNYPYMIKSPDEGVLQSEQMLYIKDYVNTMEKSMYDSIMLNNHKYSNYIDVESFVDYWFVYELAGNYEINHPKSLYLHKNRQGKIKAGPVWDFDYGTFTEYEFSRFANSTAFYYEQLFNDKWFVGIVKNRWKEFYPRFATIPEYIIKESVRLKKSEWFNHKLWPISPFWNNVNGGAYCSYDEAVKDLIDSYQAKLAWMDSQIRNM